MTHITCRVTAKNCDQLRNPTLCNRVWATFTFTCENSIDLLILHCFDGPLTMTSRISSVCRTSFFQLRQLRALRRSLTPEATRALVQAFVSYRLDYCNSLLAGVADVHLCRLQSVQNAAACLVSGARCHDHITPILATLHRLPVRQRVIFKTAVPVWKCLHDAAPRYLANLCVPAASTDGRRQCRSAVSGVLLVPWTRTSTAQRSFAVCVWSQDLEPTTNGPPISRTVARFIQVPAQYPLVCSSTRQCWLQLWVSCTIVRRCCDCTAS